MMWSYFSSDAPVLIQGITGKEGMRMARWLLQSGVNVVGGVTPGKGGQRVEDRPVFETVDDACRAVPGLETSCIVVPSSRVRSAVEEALKAGIRYINILTEQVPVHDVFAMRKQAAEVGATILGPSSVGYLQFPRFRLGYLGGERPFDQLTEGGTAILSTSGGMTNELMMSLGRHGIGIRTVFAIGGDAVPATSLEDALAWCEADASVQMIVLFVEPGRPLLRSLCSGERTFAKPTVVFLAGEVLDDLPRGVPYGHTGTVLGEQEPSVADVRRMLRERGIVCVGSMSEYLSECTRLCQNQ